MFASLVLSMAAATKKEKKRKEKKKLTLGSIDLKRITRCKLALIFPSADHRKFLSLFGSEAAIL